LRPLERGEICVSFFPSGRRDILLESEFLLVDRSFQPGEFCKRSIDDVRSGVIEKTHVKARLAHAISGEILDGWKTLDDVDPTGEADVGDYVVRVA
jgi:ubiquitin-conjugating enzyme E2 O